jgi:hypothetical protein
MIVSNSRTLPELAAAVPRRVRPQVEVEEEGEIGAPFPQGWQMDPDDVQAVEEIGTERARRYQVT